MSGGVPPAAEPRQTTVQIGPLRLVGAPAIGALLFVLGVVVALVAYLRPHPSWLWVSAGLWLFFLVYWSRAAVKTGANQRAESRESRRLHERLMNIALLLLFVPVPGLTRRFLPLSLSVILAGIAVHVGSLAFAIWARHHLGKNWSGAITVKVDHQLIRTGPYAIVRHPIYTSMLGMFVGTSLVSGQWHAAAGVALIAYAYWRKIRLEEATLREAFGAEYAAYASETRALIPWLL